MDTCPSALAKTPTGALTGRRAIVTGAASGIGAATTRCLAAHGVRVLALDWDESVADLAAPSIVPYRADATDPGDMNHAAQRIAEEFGGVDIAILNVAVSRRGLIDTSPVEHFRLTMNGTLMSVVNGLKALLPLLKASGHGSIVVTSSGAAYSGAPGGGAYGAAKAGVNNLVRSLAIDLADDAIRINAVCPGPIRTRTNEIDWRDPALASAIAQRIPAGDWGAPEDVADVIAFLASDEASYVTGTLIPVDGGLAATSQVFPPVCKFPATPNQRTSR